MTRKHMVSLLLTSILCLVLTGGISASSFQWVTGDRIGNPNAKTTLTMWLHRGFGPRSDYPVQRERIIERMESWARKHPDVKIEITMDMPSDKVDDYMVKLYEAAKTGNAPDMASVDSFWLPKYLASESKLKQVPQPLDPYLTQDELNSYVPAYRDFCTDSEGHLRAHFFYTDVRVLWYRKDLVKEPPKTWEDLIQQCKAIMATHPEIKDGFLTYGGRYENSTFGVLWQTFWASGGELVDAKGRPCFNEGANREKMLAALKLYRRLVDEGIMPTKVASIAGSADLNAAVASSKPIFFAGGHWHYASLPKVLGKDFEKYEMAPPPVFKGDPTVTGAGGWTQVVFASDPVKRALAADFIWYVYGDMEGMAASTIDALPTMKNVIDNYKGLEKDHFRYEASQMLKFSRLRPGAAIYPDISRAMQIALGEVIVGSKTAEQALDEAWATVMEAYKNLPK